MSPFMFQILHPLWVGILFNLMMTVVNFSVPWDSRFATWYFDRNGGVKIMATGWAIFITWSIWNGVRYS